MQKTSHLRLNTWVEEDPVSLAEMNENFTLLDADAAAKTARVSQHSNALKTLALHTAQRALEAYHVDVYSGDGDGDSLILADFSKHGDWSAVENVMLAEASIQNAGNGYTGYEKDLPLIYLSTSEWLEIDRFEALQSGNLAGINLDVRESAAPAQSGKVNIRIKDGQTVIAEYANCYSGNLPHFNDCALTIGHTYVIEAITTDRTHQISVVGSFGVSVTPSAAQSGYVITKETSVSGSTLHLWVYGTGSAPTVSMLNHVGTMQAVPAVGSESVKDIIGNAVTRYAFAFENFSWNKVRIRVQISGQSEISSVCGIVL